MGKLFKFSRKIKTTEKARKEPLDSQKKHCFYNKPLSPVSKITIAEYQPTLPSAEYPYLISTTLISLLFFNQSLISFSKLTFFLFPAKTFTRKIVTSPFRFLMKDNLYQNSLSNNVLMLLQNSSHSSGKALLPVNLNL